jgi:hypothetical protein
MASLDLVHQDKRIPLVRVSNKGAGKLWDADRAVNRNNAQAEFDNRQAILTNHRFRTAKQKRVWKLHAEGLYVREIATRMKCSKSDIGRTLQAVRDDYAKLGEPTAAQLAALVKACDPETLVLFFALIRRALEAPAEMRALLDKADKSPALRALIDPEPTTEPVFYDEHSDNAAD